MISAVDPPDAQVDPRARRAVPLIAAALAVIVVAGLLYLRPAPAPHFLTGAPPVPELTPGYRATYDFISPSLGWAAILQSNTGELYVFRTTDATRHWHEQFSGLVTTNFSPSIQFFDIEHGLLNLDRLYSTSDGGTSWNVISLPDATRDFTFASQSRGWALDGSQLYSTRDGGLTWQTAGSLPEAVSLGGGGLASYAFRTDGEGWLGSNASEPAVYTTSNGGATWRSIQLPAFPPPNPSTVGGKGGKPYFISTSVRLTPNGVLALAADGFGQGHAYISYDTGRSWVSITFPADPLRVFNLSFVDARHWWLSFPGILYATADAGRSWKAVDSTTTDNISDWMMGAASAIDSRHGWAVIGSPNQRNQSSGLAMTSDGGLHWAPVNVPNPA